MAVNRRKQDVAVLREAIKRRWRGRAGLVGSLYDFLRWLDQPADLPGILSDFLGSDTSRAGLDRPIFVWGAGRSGTTILYELLGKHPDVACPLDPVSGIPVEDTFFWWEAFDEQRGPMDTSLIRRARVRHLRRQMGAMVAQQGKHRFLGKSPFMTQWVPLVNAVYPDSRHIHIIRDGRAVVNSALHLTRIAEKEKYGRGDRVFGPHPPSMRDPLALPPALFYARQWVELVEGGRQAAAVLGERYFELRYEDFVRDTRGLMRAVLDHARLGYDAGFVETAFPPALTDQNRKFRSGQSAIGEDEWVYLEVMNPLLAALGYGDG
jgi:hypothetical protein